MKIAAWCAATTAGALAMLAQMPFDRGIPGEWQWKHLVHQDASSAKTAVLLILAAFAASALMIWRVHRARKDGKNVGRATFAALAVLFGCGVLCDREILCSGRFGADESVLAITHYFSTGYLTAAARASGEDLTRDYVRKVLTVPENEAPHHVHVHPPGNVWLARAFLALAAAHPLDEAPEDLAEACDVPKVQLDAARYLAELFFWSLQLAKFIVMLLLLRIAGSRGLPGMLLTAFGSGGAILFLGHYDTLYTLITAGLAAAYVLGRGQLRAAMLGVLCAAGTCFTLAYGLPILLFGSVLLARRRGKEFCVFALSGLAAAGLLACCGVDMVAIPLRVMENQQAFNLFAHRSWRWIYGNVPDALCSAGPATAFFACGWLARWKRMTVFHWIAGAFVLLVFSTVLRGELARLMIFYLPLLWLAAGVYAARRHREAAKPDFYAAVWSAAMLTLVLRNCFALTVIG